MKGDIVHEHSLDDLADALASRRFAVSRQVATRMGRDIGYVDLVAERGGRRLAIEVEMSARRVANDLRKAAALGASLWIVVPNRRVVRAVRRRLADLGVRPTAPWICVLTLGQAMHRLKNCFPLFPLS
jgi:hypothetical protein